LRAHDELIRGVAARPTVADQAVTIENRMDGAFGRNSDILIEPSDSAVNRKQ
jgi:hypothetical protein